MFFLDHAWLVPAIPAVHDYTYHWDWSTNSFVATLVRSVRFDGLPLVFSEDFEILCSRCADVK